MKKGFKRFLSGTLATVMAVAGMTIGMATSVMAATNTYLFVPSADINTDDYFTASTSTHTGDAVVGGTFEVDGVTYDATKALKFDSKGSIEFNVVGTADVTIVWAGRANKTSTCSINIDGTDVQETSVNTLVTSKVSGLNAGSHIIQRTKNESSIYFVKVEDTVSENAKTYTINGSSNAVAGDVLTIDGTEVTVRENGNWSFTKTSESLPYENGAELTVTSDKYKDATITLTYDEASLSYTASDLSLELWVLEPLAEGSYDSAVVSNGYPNFAITGESSAGKYDNGGTIEFMVNDNATVKVTYKCGSTSTGKSAKFDIFDIDGNVVATGYTQEGASGLPWLELITPTKLAAGTYKIVSTASSTTAQLNSIEVSYSDPEYSKSTIDSADTVGVINDGTNFYAVSVITQDQVNSANMLYQRTESGEDVSSSDTVYKEIQIGDRTYTATDFLKTATENDYVFASIIEKDSFEGTNTSPSVSTVRDDVKTIKTVLE